MWRWYTHFLLAAAVLGSGAPDAPAQIPASAAEDFQTALGHFQAARYEAALQLTTALEQRYPASADIQQLHAIVLDLNGRPEAAAEHFARAVDLNPESPALRSNYATSLMRLGRTREAVKQFKAVLRRQPEQPTANFNLGTILMEQGDAEAALPYLERAYRHQPEVYENGYQLAFCRFILGRHEAVKKVLDGLGESAAGRIEYRLLRALNDDALGLENRVGSLLTELKPGLEAQPALRRQIVPLLLSRGLYREALPWLETAVRERPGSDGAWLALARARLALGSAEPALQAAERALGLRDSGEAHALLGDILESLDRPLEAVQHYQRAAQLDPSEHHLFSLGYEFLVHWNWETAQQVFQQALERFPDSWRLWLGLGASHLGRNQNPEAAQAFLTAIRHSSQPLAYHLLSLSFDQAAEWQDEARAAFERFHRANPDDPWANYYRTMAVFRQYKSEAGSNPERLQQPLQDLARIGRQHADFFEAHFLLGEIYAFLNDWEAAAAALRRATDSRPDDMQANYKLGLALQRLGRTEEARAALQRYQELKQQEDQAVSERMAATKQFIIELKQP